MLIIGLVVFIVILQAYNVMYVFNKSLLDCYITSIKLLRFSFVEKLLVCYIKNKLKVFFTVTYESQPLFDTN
jgi:hypothetical protein